MVKTKTVYLEKEIASIISSRDIFSIIESKIEKENSDSVNLDFSNVDFVSRSAAHELILLQERYKLKNVFVSFINTNKDVREMIRVVASNRVLPNTKEIEFNPQIVNIKELMK